MQYKIPQNVGIEDRIVGPLTLRQLIILAVGFGISYVLFAILNKIYELNVLEYIVIGLPGLLAVAFALIRINDIPLMKFMFLFLEFAIKPKKRVWNHQGIASLVSPDLTETAKAGITSIEQSELDRKAKSAANLEELTRMLDSGGFENVKEVEHKDIDKTQDDDLMTEAYFGHKREESPTQNMYWRTKDSQKKRLDILASLPPTQIKKETKDNTIVKEQARDTKKESNVGGQKLAQIQPKATTAKPAEIKPSPAKAPKQTVQTTSNQPKLSAQKPAPIQKAAQTSPTAMEDKNKPRKRNRPIPQPVRKNNHINTINKNEPAKYIPNQPPKKTGQIQKKKSEMPKKAGEFDFRELEKGEIEINLD